MIEFREFPAARVEEWDDILLTFRDFNFQQTRAFAAIDAGRRSDVRRWVLAEGERVLVMGQALIQRPLPGVCIAVLRRGPLYQASSEAATNVKHLRSFLTQLIDAFKHERFHYVGVFLAGERTTATEIALREAGLSRPFFERTPYITFVVEVYKDPDQNMKAFDRKWRNQLRRAESLDPVFRWGNDDDLVASYVTLHNAMCRVKSIESYSLSADRLLAMRRHLGAGLQILIGSEGHHDVCGCIVVITGHKAFYYYAAANQRGREGYFSNAMVWNLLQRLRDLGVTEIDMSQVDPVRNWGGYNFKRGVGGRPVAYDGEWEHCRPRSLKVAMNLALLWRTSRLYR